MCSPLQVEQPVQSADQKAASVTAGPHPKSERLVLWHAPARGIKTTLIVHVAMGSRMLEVYRAVRPSYLRTWRVHLDGNAIRHVDEIVAGIIQTGSAIRSCPRRHARDDVVWAAMTSPWREDFGLDFRHTAGPTVCDEFERYANELMQLAELECVDLVCLRPGEEIGRLACAAGQEGDSCREDRQQVPASALE